MVWEHCLEEPGQRAALISLVTVPKISHGLSGCCHCSCPHVNRAWDEPVSIHIQGAHKSPLSRGCIAMPILNLVSPLSRHGGATPICTHWSPMFRGWVVTPTPSHLSQRHMLEASSTQNEDRLGQRESSEAIEGCPGPHILFISFNNGSTQSV